MASSPSRSSGRTMPTNSTSRCRTLLKSIDRPAAIFIDALDQLKKPYRLGWLPDQLPPRLKIVVSVLNDAAYEEDSGVYRALRQRLPSEAFLEIEPLTEAQGRDILLALEASAQRRLRPGQRDYVLGRFEEAGASPLYLRVAFEIARGVAELGRGRPGPLRACRGHRGAHRPAHCRAHERAPPRARARQPHARLPRGRQGRPQRQGDDRGPVARRGVMEAISPEAWCTPPSGMGCGRPSCRTRSGCASIASWRRCSSRSASTSSRCCSSSTASWPTSRASGTTRPPRPPCTARSPTISTPAHGTAGKDAVASGRRTYARRSLSELPYQLFHAGRRARLDEILMAPDWMQQKLAAIGVRTLIDDYQYAHTKAQRLTGQTLELAGWRARARRAPARTANPGPLAGRPCATSRRGGRIDGLLRAGRAAGHRRPPWLPAGQASRRPAARRCAVSRATAAG